MNALRLLLFPVGLAYSCVTMLRNLLYDIGVFKAYEFPLKSICVGNLSVGGTGKTPHVAYIAQLFKSNQDIQILSRGYGRSTKGFKEVLANSSAEEVGDEPLLYVHRFKAEVAVSVCESRKAGIEQITSLRNPSLLLLDDAFQHRAVKAGFSIVLSDFSSPYFNDFHLPTGNLREHKRGLKRADILIFTKCPGDLSAIEKEAYYKRSNFPKDHIYFSSIVYGSWIPMTQVAHDDFYEHVLLVTGIANPQPLQEFLAENHKTEILRFKDHHVFTLKDIAEIREKFDTFAQGRKAILTTEKDFMRLRPFLSDEELQKIPWFYQSMEVKIDREQAFIHELNTYVNTI